MRTPTPHRACLSAFFAALVCVLGGCGSWDSFFDPSVLGRWEQTPTVVPILDRIAAIETRDGETIEFSEVAQGDLVPQVDEYGISAGDQLLVTVWDLVTPGVPEQLQRVVDQNGYIEIPQLGRVYLAGQSEAGANQAIVEKLRPFIQDPLVSVVVQSRRAQTFNVQGQVAAPGLYPIPAADFRVMEALIAAGGVNEATVTDLFVIRQVTLDSRLEGRPESPGDEAAPGSGAGRSPAAQPAGGDELIDIINELTRPEEPGAPGAFAGSGVAAGLRQPANAGREPAIDLVDPEAPRSSGSGTPGGAGAPATGRWVFLNGSWVKSGGAAASPGGVDEGVDAEPSSDPVVTQRVIRIPLKPLLGGDARYNIVVRPGDVLRVPPPELGNVYVAGQVARPGVYTLPAIGRLTLTRVITAAGGLGALAIPERADLTRMVGPDRQATIMLNLRAIAEGTQPDVFLKPDDQVNVGTNFWALPLAVIRGGFRVSYGFGFLLDRNFGNDVFGAPPFAGPGGG